MKITKGWRVWFENCGDKPVFRKSLKEGRINYNHYRPWTNLDQMELDGIVNLPTHGGPRPGSGRPPSGKARTKLQITLPPALVAKMDRDRGKQSRSEWIEAQIIPPR